MDIAQGLSLGHSVGIRTEDLASRLCVTPDVLRETPPRDWRPVLAKMCRQVAADAEGFAVKLERDVEHAQKT